MVVGDEEEAQSLDVGEEFFGEGKGFSDEAGQRLAQREIEAFDVVGESVSLETGVMLVCGHHALVTSVEVGVAQATFVGGRDSFPQTLARERVARAIPPCHYLARSAAQRDPNPHAVFLFANE